MLPFAGPKLKRTEEQQYEATLYKELMNKKMIVYAIHPYIKLQELVALKETESKTESFSGWMKFSDEDLMSLLVGALVLLRKIHESGYALGRVEL